MGVYAVSSGSSGGGQDSDAGSHGTFASGSPRGSGLRVPEEEGQPAAVDVEDGGGLLQPPGWLRRACCGWRGGAGGGKAAGAAGAGASSPPKKPGWLRLQWIKLKLMKEEMRRSQDYAMYCALRIDRGWGQEPCGLRAALRTPAGCVFPSGETAGLKCCTACCTARARRRSAAPSAAHAALDACPCRPAAHAASSGRPWWASTSRWSSSLPSRPATTLNP